MWVKQNSIRNNLYEVIFRSKKTVLKESCLFFFVFRQDPNAGAKDKRSCGDDVTNSPMKVTPNTSKLKHWTPDFPNTKNTQNVRFSPS